jgi:hypothetical protein
MKKRMSRRQLLKLLGAAVGKVGLGALTGCATSVGHAEDGDLEPRAYLPLVSESPPTPTPTPTPTSTPTSVILPTLTPTPTTTPISLPENSRVVHVHDESATSWNGEVDFWNHVDQAVVDEMVDRGMMALTGASTVADAWRALLPSYRVGEGIAIKANFNNSFSCDESDRTIDALIQPINAMVRGMKQIGVAETDIWVYDAIRFIPDRFIRISDILINATYLIDMPIMKGHFGPGVSLSFKNHFGTIDQPGDLHDYVFLDGIHYRSDYSVLVDLYRNPHIVGKTILILGDGLFAAKHYDQAPQTWSTFGDRLPNSLFLAADPVAVDCVMYDLLNAEETLPALSVDQLHLAGAAGLGVFEQGDPWGSGYTKIDYLKLEL